MREWTREERYRVLYDAEEIRDLHVRNSQSVYRQTYHIQPICGLSSDPNGFTYFNGTWHLFYQWCPWGAVHGLKYWYHASSKDLIYWKNEGIGLKPDTYYDNRGNHSGSAISEGGNLYMFYTGNHRDDDWTRTPYTCAAKMDEEGNLVKLDKPLFGPRPEYTEHQRDPKVFYVPEQKKYFIFIGAQTADLKGTVLVYESEELLAGWKFRGQLTVPGYESLGGMWECPCIQTIDGKDILLFSPQYTKLPGRAESTNHNIYFIGKMDYDTLTFTPEGGYKYLDFGFDFYAAQLASNVGDPSKAIIVGWIGLPDNHYPSEEEDYEGSMALPRELRLENGKLMQRPIPEIVGLRGEELEAGEKGTLPAAAEMIIDTDGSEFDLALYCKADGTGGLTLHYDPATKTCTVDKTGLNKRFNQNVGEVLDMPLETELKQLRIFIDHSSTEFFVNDGEETFTAHTYPEAEEFNYCMKGNACVKLWAINPSVKDDFVV